MKDPEVLDSTHAGNDRRADVKHLAYAEAAIMLLECLLLRLIERQVLTSAETISLIEDALATKRQMVVEGEHPEISVVASGVLRNLANSVAAAE